ncbi:hypothetical protein DN069_27705 [Streptacidiphilus pinicola]|uniref:Uncharacterized protein n=1 Tax=Streptacidiphilus pinicola TaxID=2219663 RepID=A0A2X0IBX4_9ACTN|nr:hypothetical protein [Streptacidiphilus pinicola]RAG82452.1 hypothetical protein DN069_27705 [Streptacidiphilus pinicola]
MPCITGWHTSGVGPFKAVGPGQGFALRDITALADVRMVSFRQLVHWLEAQDPSVLAKLRGLNVGQ